VSLVTQAEYARRRGISRVAAHKRTVTAGGPIPVHGPRYDAGVLAPAVRARATP